MVSIAPTSMHNCPLVRWIVSMAVMDHEATTRTIAQHIQCFHIDAIRIIQHNLQLSGMSTSYQLLLLSLTGNHKYLCYQWGNKDKDVERHCVFCRIPLLPAISRWSYSSLETP
ncbi:hypothetical protein TNCV_2223641 [Trichonephila clavipes]|nr:hypothetical protein TNCV_2223641 [Trichonephila clavipes]